MKMQNDSGFLSVYWKWRPVTNGSSLNAINIIRFIGHRFLYFPLIITFIEILRITYYYLFWITKSFYIENKTTIKFHIQLTAIKKIKWSFHANCTWPIYSHMDKNRTWKTSKFLFHLENKCQNSNYHKCLNILF